MQRCESEPAHGTAGGWGSDFIFIFSLSLSALSFHPSIYLSFHLSIHLSIYVVIYLSIYAYVSQYLFIYLFIYHTWKFEHGRENDMCFTLLTWDQLKAANIEITCTWPSLYLWSFTWEIKGLQITNKISSHSWSLSNVWTFTSWIHLLEPFIYFNWCEPVTFSMRMPSFPTPTCKQKCNVVSQNCCVYIYIYLSIMFTCFFLW